MSDSDLSDPPPDEGTIESELRDIVRQIYKNGNLEELTVKRVRIAAEKNLGLEDSFLKGPQWKDRSKSIIESEAAKQGSENQSTPKPSPKTQTKKQAPPTKAVKRSSIDEELKPEKRRKTEKSHVKAPAAESEVEVKSAQRPPETTGSELSALDSDAFTDEDVKPPVKDSKTKESAVAPVLSESEMSELIDDEPKQRRKRGRGKTDVAPSKSHKTKKKPEVDDDQAESEMSEVIDDEPKKKQKKGASANDEAGSRKQKRKKEAPADEDPDSLEIKKLQGWLVSCGIRKMWWKELKPYETSKAKIRHLKSMLSDVGMTGRYSKEKAEQIREARELQADLEAVQEGEKHWGKGEEEEEEEEDLPARPKRRLARGLEGLDFLNDDDGEETD